MRTHSAAPAEHGEVVEMTDPSDVRVQDTPTDTSTMKEIFSAVKGVNTVESNSLEDQDGTLKSTKSTREDAAGMQRSKYCHGYNDYPTTYTNTTQWARTSSLSGISVYCRSRPSLPLQQQHGRLAFSFLHLD